MVCLGVTEIFEARKPKDPSVIAEIDGGVELLSEKKRGKRAIVVRSESGIEREHLVAHNKHLRVHSGDRVQAGDSLVDGPLVPHDILRISGEEAVQQYLTREIQNVYRSQRVEINDKHIEIIVSQMLRKVQIESPGDTELLPGSILDKTEFRQANEAVGTCVRITEQGDSEFDLGTIIPKDVLEQANAQIEALGGESAKGSKPKKATAATQLLGITKASVQSSSFISAASFQETTKVLTEAALGGRIDSLVGLKENVILGHLIPAGTGFHTIHEAEVRIYPEALEELAAEKERVLERSFPLLESALHAGTAGGIEGNGEGSPVAAPVGDLPGGLDALLGEVPADSPTAESQPEETAFPSDANQANPNLISPSQTSASQISPGQVSPSILPGTDDGSATTESNPTDREFPELGTSTPDSEEAQ